LDENGVRGDIVPRFTDNEDCQNAYRNFACYLNFPRCDAEARSLVLCTSVCENFFRACGYAKDMWRCGDPRYFGGDGPEDAKDLDANGFPTYWRAMFPGAPFRLNRFDEDGAPVAVCTPSIEGAATHAGVSMGAVGLLVLVGVLRALRRPALDAA
jgi:hypothetical protein